jgi:hypothetical protein
MWILRKDARNILWAILIESIVQMNYMCFMAYAYIWALCKSERVADLTSIIGEIGYQIGWDSMLLLISGLILVYVFKQIQENKFELSPNS